LAELDEDETIIQESISPFRKGGQGALNFHCSVIARSDLCDVTISSTHSVISEERLKRRENLILLTFFEEENRKR